MNSVLLNWSLLNQDDTNLNTSSSTISCLFETKTAHEAYFPTIPKVKTELGMPSPIPKVRTEKIPNFLG